MQLYQTVAIDVNGKQIIDNCFASRDAAMRYGEQHYDHDRNIAEWYVEAI